METRVRFAPSPTGHLHIGNARTAILNWLFAKHTNGKFILRIEDTDPERSADEFIKPIFEDLKWLGLPWDEGPDVGGSMQPYRQSERFDIYKKYAQNLLSDGKAYYCYCTSDELDQMRKESLAKGGTGFYNQKCLHLSETEKDEFVEQGRKPTIRFKVPENAEIKFDDVVRGELKWDSENISDFVIMRSEGIPTYNFAVVVDDGLMKISHVIRGDDHVSNTPRQILLYQALGFEIPEFVHIPMILGDDRSRLSKRHGATSLDQYHNKGYLPEALVNFLSLLSWSSESGDEILSIERLINEIDLNRISKSAAVFDVEKLNWMNGTYIRQTELKRLTELSIPFFQQKDYPVGDVDKTENIISILQEKVDYLEQLPEHAAIFFRDKVRIENSEAKSMVRQDSTQKVFWSFLRELEAIENIDRDIFRRMMKTVQNETGIMGKNLWMPVRIALTGDLHGPDLPMVAEILGREKCEKFIKQVIIR
ncbi:glutamate--tRNA ligase [candidate division KSB1 bacterium]|nr:glutamate--tRNA ligase [candidate division KSB1 bacterium]MBL7092984.1 glutamate--tRNA ligase [candidate division KSB1 bacterium]